MQCKHININWAINKEKGKQILRLSIFYQCVYLHKWYDWSVKSCDLRNKDILFDYMLICPILVKHSFLSSIDLQSTFAPEFWHVVLAELLSSYVLGCYKPL
jgi:hypothetical protein